MIQGEICRVTEEKEKNYEISARMPQKIDGDCHEREKNIKRDKYEGMMISKNAMEC